MATIKNRLTQVHQYVWYGAVKQKYVKTKCLKIGEQRQQIEQNVIEISTYEEGVFKTYRPNQDYSSPMQRVKENLTDLNVVICIQLL